MMLARQVRGAVGCNAPFKKEAFDRLLIAVRGTTRVREESAASAAAYIKLSRACFDLAPT